MLNLLLYLILEDFKYKINNYGIKKITNKSNFYLKYFFLTLNLIKIY